MDQKKIDKDVYYEKIPSTVLSTSNSVQKMSPAATTLKIVLWLFVKTINVFFIPFHIPRLFKKSEAIPSIKNDVLLVPASLLAERIRKRELTSEQVVRAYIERVEEINPILNAVIEDRFEEAIEEAKNADKLISSGTMTVEQLSENYPLLGIPITVKGSIEVANMMSTGGSLTRTGIIAKEDATTVKYAKEAGAIPILTSNIPELCMNWETSNKLKGTTKNPHNTVRTAGGSSGGEASLLAAAGSIIGLGSDIAGSLRLPAHFCGVWGHKPSPGAVSFAGHYPSCKNHEEWEAVFTLGPMARYATDLKLLLEIIVEPSMKEALMLDVPVDVRDLKVFYMEEIASSLTTVVNDNCLMALHKVINHFNIICYNNCEQVNLTSMKFAPEISSVILLEIDEIDNLFTGRGEGATEELFRYMTGRSKSVITSIFYGIARKLTKFLPNSMIDRFRDQLLELRTDFINLLGNNGVFIFPTFPTEAHHHGDILRKCFDPTYLWIFNSLGLPVTNCPVAFTSSGLPVGIQVVGAPNCDRLTLAVAIEIERKFGGWQPPKFRK